MTKFKNTYTKYSITLNRTKYKGFFKKIKLFSSIREKRKGHAAEKSGKRPFMKSDFQIKSVIIRMLFMA